MKKIIPIFLTLLLFFTSLTPIFQTPFSPQKAYAETCSYVVDGQDNIRFVTDSTGPKIRSTDYDPFGNITGTNGTLTGNKYQFNTQQNDPDSGMYYLRARYYDPATGRFISRDPVKGTLANPQSQNPYAYSGNDPINLSDPSGEFVETAWDVANIAYDIATCDWGSLAFDTGAMLVPGLPAGLTKVGKVAKVADDVNDIGKTSKRINNLEDLNDLTKSPGPGWEWRGTGQPGSSQGSWYNPSTNEYIYSHPDSPKHGSHIDYRGIDGKEYRRYPDGRIEPK